MASVLPAVTAERESHAMQANAQTAAVSAIKMKTAVPVSNAIMANALLRRTVPVPQTATAVPESNATQENVPMPPMAHALPTQIAAASPVYPVTVHNTQPFQATSQPAKSGLFLLEMWI